MHNKHLSTDAVRPARVREMFSRIAGRYDFLNDLISFGLHRRWKRETVRAANDECPPERLLDLCCGSGDLAFLAEDQGARQVVGADFTLPMLDVAQRRKRSGGRATRFVQADALRLPFPDASFDAVTVAYGLRNVADLPAALAEARRVLAPGGRLVALDFGKPESPLVRGLYMTYLRTAMPVIGWLFHGDAGTYRYIPESLARYPGQRGVESLMRDAGFRNARHRDLVLGTMGINLAEK